MEYIHVYVSFTAFYIHVHVQGLDELSKKSHSEVKKYLQEEIDKRFIYVHVSISLWVRVPGYTIRSQCDMHVQSILISAISSFPVMWFISFDQNSHEHMFPLHRNYNILYKCMYIN